jgi:hypothetical protein
MKKTLWMCLLTACFTTFSINAFAAYECYAGDKGGHMWKSAGSTEERATAVAMSFCTGYSPDSASCQFKKCIAQ